MAKVLNTEFVKILEEIEIIYKNRGKLYDNSDPFRANAYKNAKNQILEVEFDITDVKQLEKLKIKGSILDNLNSYVTNGKVDIIENEKNNVIHQFCKIHGVGPKKALELSKEVNSIEELKKRPELLNKNYKKNGTENAAQKGLKYFDELQERIPRREIEKYEKTIRKKLDTLVKNSVTNYKNLKMEIVGSYRRGAKDSGDIDVILTSDNHDDFNKIIDNLIDSNIIIETLSRGSKKLLGISQLKGHIPRRIDFLYTTQKEYPFALLYFTGSKSFNVRMRKQAIQKKYRLNESELVGAENITIKTEKDIFKVLDFEYKEPNDRT